MNAVVVHHHGGPEQLVYESVTDPIPDEGQVVIETRCSSVNFADIKARRGGYKNYEPPFIPGLDAAGVITALGSGVQSLKLGQRVAAYTTGGAYAEKVLAEENLCFLLPETVSFEQGAGIGIFITAYNLLTLAGRLQKGETVLIHAGAGGVGSSLIQLAKVLGAGRVLTTVGSEAKKALVSELGADEVINYRQEDFAQRVLEISSNGADLILDSIAGETAEKGMSCLAPFGRLVIFGHTGAGAAQFDSKQLHSQNRAVLGYSSGGYRKHYPEILQQSAEAVLKLLAEKRLRLLIGASFKLEQAAKAQALVESRKSSGKVLLTP